VKPAFTKDGKTIRPLGTEVDTAFKLLNSLDEKQRTQAILKKRTSDLVLGPGMDGKEMQPDGIKGSELNEKQQALLIDLAGAWVTILHEASVNPRMADIPPRLKTPISAGAVRPRKGAPPTSEYKAQASWSNTHPRGVPISAQR
jgi:hypothetical protein